MKQVKRSNMPYDPHAEGRQWTLVGEASGVTTYAMDVWAADPLDMVLGALVRTVDFCETGEYSSAMVFVPGTSVFSLFTKRTEGEGS